MHWSDWVTMIGAVVVTPALLLLAARSVHARIDALNTGLDALNAGMDAVVQGVSRLGSDLASLVAYVGGKSGDGISDAIDAKALSAAVAASPTPLTEKGERIAKRIQAQALVNRYRHHIRIPEDASKLDIQETCLAFAVHGLSRVVSRAEWQVIEDEIYEIGGDRKEVLVIHGILFRDAFLAERGRPVPVRAS